MANNNKPIAFSRTVEQIESVEAAERRKLRADILSQGGSCLTCNHTKVAVGKRLLCKLKDNKLVSQYNFCEKWVKLKVKGK